MKPPQGKQHQNRKENHGELRTAQRFGIRNVVVSQAFAFQGENALPAVRAVWAVIDDETKETNEKDRRRKR